VFVTLGDPETTIERDEHELEDGEFELDLDNSEENLVETLRKLDEESVAELLVEMELLSLREMRGLELTDLVLDAHPVTLGVIDDDTDLQEELLTDPDLEEDFEATDTLEEPDFVAEPDPLKVPCVLLGNSVLEPLTLPVTVPVNVIFFESLGDGEKEEKSVDQGLEERLLADDRDATEALDEPERPDEREIE